MKYLGGLMKLHKLTRHFILPIAFHKLKKLNSGLWSKLESYVISENNRIAVFTGLMLKNTDPYYVKDTTFQVPLFFF